MISEYAYFSMGEVSTNLTIFFQNKMNGKREKENAFACPSLMPVCIDRCRSWVAMHISKIEGSIHIPEISIAHLVPTRVAIY